jgi:hypothetical protein
MVGAVGATPGAVQPSERTVSGDYVPAPALAAANGARRQPSAEQATNPQPSSAIEQQQRKGCVSGIVQQRDPTVKIPLWLFRRLPQAVCALLFAAIIGGVGVFILLQSQDMQEVRVSYNHDDAEKEFTLDKDFDDDVLISYEMSQVHFNQKRYVDSKDRSILVKASLSFTSTMTCKGADTREEALWRRPTSEWSDLLDVQGDPASTTFKPCGLIANTVFTDEYRFFRKDGNNWTELVADETELTWPGDDELFENPDFGPSNINGSSFTIAGVASWLPAGRFFEHFKVWYRTPPSPRVRNLWARIPGGMSAGTYKVEFSKNSPIWTTQWKVPEKLVVFAGAHPLGSKGAAQILATVCLVLAVIEALLAVVFLLGPRLCRCPSFGKEEVERGSATSTGQESPQSPPLTSL